MLTLKPIKATAEEVAKARRKYKEESESNSGMLWLIGGMMGLSAIAMLFAGKWDAALVPVFTAVPIYQAWRREVKLGREIEQMTTTYALTESELQVLVSFNNGRETEKSSTLWRDVAGVLDKPEGVVVQHCNGMTETIPNECFETHEQRSLVRAYWRQGRSLFHPKKRKEGNASG